MDWKLAESLKKLREQVNTSWSNRDKSSDGSIGDTAHSNRKSDHNPNSAGVVTAIDIDADLSPHNTVAVLVAALQKSKDPRIKYLIWNRQITMPGDVTKWKPYHGANAHTHHAHISVSADPKLYDDASEWKLDYLAPPVEIPKDRVLEIGMAGEDVKRLQKALKIIADGRFGPNTEKAVKGFQLEKGLRVDGKAGPNTKAALGI